MSHTTVSSETRITVIGLGYVGLPVALAFAEKYSVVGFDTNPSRVEQLSRGEDINNETATGAFEEKQLLFTHDIEDIRDSDVYIIAVPTPVDDHKLPDLALLKAACITTGKVLSRGNIVVFESTVYPGCTEEVCIPILNEQSGLVLGHDYSVGYSPERINPGDKKRTLKDIRKVISASDAATLDRIEALYNSVIDAGTFRAASIKVAEAAKIIENTQRDVNIALMNELAMVFDKLDINTRDVLEAAATKWNFLEFYPGLVGGHCIDVDPYYLTYQSMKLGYTPDVILSGRRVNKTIPKFIAHKVVRHLVRSGRQLADSKALVMGITFKENVSDYRNSKVFDLIEELQTFEVDVEVYDPHVSDSDNGLKDITLVSSPEGPYDAVITAVAHDAFRIDSFDEWSEWLKADAVVFDVKQMYRRLELSSNLTYLSL